MIATSLSGTNPIFLRITLRIKSEEAPSRLTASFFPLSCAGCEIPFAVTRKAWAGFFLCSQR